MKALYSVFGQRTVDVVVAALVVARGFEGAIHVDRFGGHDRGDSVVKIEIARADQFVEGVAEGGRGERSTGDNRKAVGNGA